MIKARKITYTECPMTIHVPEAVSNFIHRFSSFIIAGHREPDVDCIGSQLVLSRILQKMGKKTHLISPGPFIRKETEEYEALFSRSLDESFLRLDPALFILDSSTYERLGHLRDELRTFPTAVIDHHSSGDEFGEVRWVDASVPSTTYLIYYLARALSVALDKGDAELVFFGLATDTGYFRHLEEGSAHVFQTIGELVDAGVSPRSIYLKMFGNRSFESRVLLGRILKRAENLYSNRLIVATEVLEEKDSFGIANRDSETLYMLLQGIEEAEVVVLIREEKPGECSVGLRSRSLDVGSIAKEYGGGGHTLAAGFNWSGEMEDIKKQLIVKFQFLDI